jgi:protein-disulfide isomerase
MSYTLLRILAATTFVVACTRSDAAPSTKREASAPVPGAAAAPGTPPRDSISDRADRGRVTGDSAAQLWVIMASDFQCPFCKQWHDTDFQPIVDKYVKTGKCASRSSTCRCKCTSMRLLPPKRPCAPPCRTSFGLMHDALFATQEKWANVPVPSAIFDSLAKSTGVNLDTWRVCVRDHLALPLVEADRQRVVAANVRSTPTFFVGDQLLAGADAKLTVADRFRTREARQEKARRTDVSALSRAAGLPSAGAAGARSGSGRAG